MHRITGRVTRIDHRQGVKEETGRAWAFDTITVLVADQAIVEVSRFTDSFCPLPDIGEEVDYAVNVVGRSAGRVNVQLDKPWADLFPRASRPAA